MEHLRIHEISSFCRSTNWGPEKSSKLSKVTQQILSRFEAQLPDPEMRFPQDIKHWPLTPWMNPWVSAT